MFGANESLSISSYSGHNLTNAKWQMWLPRYVGPGPCNEITFLIINMIETILFDMENSNTMRGSANTSIVFDQVLRMIWHAYML